MWNIDRNIVIDDFKRVIVLRHGKSKNIIAENVVVRGKEKETRAKAFWHSNYSCEWYESRKFQLWPPSGSSKKTDGELGMDPLYRTRSNVDFVWTESWNSVSFKFYDRCNRQICKNTRKKRELASVYVVYLDKERHCRESDRTKSSSSSALPNKRMMLTLNPNDKEKFPNHSLTTMIWGKNAKYSISLLILFTDSNSIQIFLLCEALEANVIELEHGSQCRKTPIMCYWSPFSIILV